MKEFWNERYANEAYAYGKKPNVFFAQQLDMLDSGKLLLPAEGEGRNAVYAAAHGWEVDAFDMSASGKMKAEQLAKEQDVEINYQVGSVEEMSYPEGHFDALALIYAHFPPGNKSAYHRILSKYLKPGGVVIFEAFSKSHLKFNTVDARSGGPKNEAMLFSTEELQADFPDFEIQLLVEEEVQLSEGDFHNGPAAVVRFVGKKK